MDAGQAPAEERPPENGLPDRYILSSALGRGAFATSFRAQDQLLNRQVVIKLLSASQQEAVDLFQKEVRITGSLSHPNIVNVLDAGFAKDGRPYYVTEWVEGQDLSAVLASSGPLGTGRSLQTAIGIAAALAYIHSRNFLHRDLKPSNILIRGWPSAPDFRNPKILDFGVAGLLSHGLTAAGMVFGTPTYMSPEQVLGLPQSSATDVYGWGLLFFEMLLGHPLRRTAGQIEQLFRSILLEELPAGELESIPSGCASLIRQCLNRKPEERPSIEAVLEELRQLDGKFADAPMPAGPTLLDSIVEAPMLRPAASPPMSQPIGKSTMARLEKPAPSAARRNVLEFRKWTWLAFAGVAGVALLVTFLPLHGSLRVLAFLGGLLLIIASIAGAFWLRRWLGNRSTAKEQAFDLALGAKTRTTLTATIALQLDDLIYRLRGLDEQILAGSVALMLDEYGRATDAKDRQSALMNVVTLSEKLGQRLSPWYVRYKEVIASAVAVVGALSGLLTTLKAFRGPHTP
jgi:serine/threonine protein kinase